jgi:hypothetical protein
MRCIFAYEEAQAVLPEIGILLRSDVAETAAQRKPPTELATRDVIGCNI